MPKGDEPRTRAIDTGRDRLDPPKSGLSARSQRVAWAFVEALLADENDDMQLEPASYEVCSRAVTALDRAVGRSSPDIHRGFAVLSFLMEWLPLFIIGVFGRMSRLPLESRIAYLEALESSSIGLLSMLFTAFKVPLSVPAFEDGDELRSTGFDRSSTAARRGRLPIAGSTQPDQQPLETVEVPR